MSNRPENVQIDGWLPTRSGQVLFVKAPTSPERMLLTRLLVVLGLFLTVIVVLWFDREGLMDHMDGEVSFGDIVYFAMITVTTVGYGDIVPIESHTRIVDALFITPVRIFIWFIFLGTAYQLVIQKVVEGYRMARLKGRLQGHIIVCGFGETGHVAAREMVTKGTSPSDIVIIDKSDQVVSEAANQGYIGLRGDPTHERILLDAGVKNARAIIISLGADDSGVLAVLTARHLNPKARIVTVVLEDENAKLLKQAGADSVVIPSQAGGYLLADSIGSSYVNDYIFDLLTSDGRVELVERKPFKDEVGRSMKDLVRGIAVRLYRGGEPIGFYEKEKSLIQAEDLLLVIEPVKENDTGRTKSAKAS